MSDGEIRRIEVELRDSRDQLQLALSAARMGTWDWDMATQELTWSPGLDVIHGMLPGTFDGTFEGFLRVVHPDDRERLQADIGASLEGGGPFATEFRAIGHDGAVRWIAGEGRVVTDEEGRPRRMIGVGRDITAPRRAEEALRESEERFRVMADSAPVLIWLADTTGARIYFNAGWLRFTGRSLEDQVGDGWAEGVHPDDHERCLTLYRAAVDRREPFEMEYRLRRHDGEYRWMLVKGLPRWGPGGFEGVVGTCVDITERRRREEGDRLLADVGLVLDLPLAAEERLAEMAGTLLPRVADACVVDLLDEGGGTRRVAVAHVDPRYQDMLAALPPPLPESPIGTVARSGDPVLIAEVSEDWNARAAHGAADAETRRRINTRSAVVVPLAARGRRIGVMTLSTSRDHSNRALDTDDLRLAEQIAVRAALAIDNAHLFRAQRRIADTLQQALMPASLPEVPGAVLSASYVAMGEGIEAGGDFYDVFPCSGAWMLVAGDVCGKGPEAASLTALARYTMRALAPFGADPARLLERLNAAAVAQRPGSSQFLTACVGRVVAHEGGLSVALAAGGHPRPLVQRADGQVEAVEVRGPLLAVFEDVSLTSEVVELDPGDRLVLYTDGLTEARTPNGLLAEDGLAEAVASLAPVPGDLLAEALTDAVRSAAGGALRDDMAVLVIEAARPLP